MYGYCADGFRRALIYEFLPNDSLEKFASSDRDKRLLGWKKLLEIAMGIAKELSIFTKDITDFGLAKLCSKEQSVVSMTTARGTIGYIAPEVFSRNFGNVSSKSDIYSFGMLLLEMVGGKKNFDVMVNSTNQIYFPEWIYNRLDGGEELGIHIQDEGEAKIAKKLAIVGLWCIQWYPVDRPSMHGVIQMLEGDGDTLIKPPNPFASTNPTLAMGQSSGRPFNSELEVIVESEEKKIKRKDHLKIERFLEDYRALKPARYSYADIKKITNQKDKILNSTKGNGEEFINEVGIIGTIHHVNVVRLVGYCADGFRRALIYEFLPNDSLEKFASSDRNKHLLGWKKLLEIAMGIAEGIEYLHQGCDQQILHFDIKPHNIFPDENLNPKITDFGIAKLCSKEQNVVSMTTARGTIGYIAPEVFSRNFENVSYKSDIYSFGMLLLEMVGGKKNFDVMVSSTNKIYFPNGFTIVWIVEKS
ncbi:hypothetical protein RHSIM_Rhsim03G0203300 [Rhododendron simsii]|uniref:non-specific serine/threonine protein kinase n=1 Tax=Rhododendron simsii TaxID=118357 RepID=A0A834LRB1_RHOSS|nr:hypothetical protein RHSIM_Rhsim03G0203300 [Rhododendron simsii]